MEETRQTDHKSVETFEWSSSQQKDAVGQTVEPSDETGLDAVKSNLNDLSQLRQRFRTLIGEELEQLDEKWQHLAKDSKEKVDQLVNCAYSKKENAEKIVLKAVSDVCWNVRHFKELPHWLQENDYLLFGHRPELGSFKSCIKSMFKLHTGKPGECRR